ncbi:hypothetical protein [Nitrospirillum iridis]|uniref:PRC-barrel domain-containing protein n=1 Tax=Nitrospirillum iridis TaxID=765888 RepID=A0A7X0B0Z0_9PROT|nr:hypothetical protein [Nitrospirillum iridis]MBB6253337.1 hypothetical protein [Nitrospirillum iridis]
MKKILPLLTIALGLAVPAFAQAPSDTALVGAGKPLVDANGDRIGPVYRVGDDGSVQVIVDGKLYNVPAATLSVADGKVVTSLKKKEVLGRH